MLHGWIELSLKKNMNMSFTNHIRGKALIRVIIGPRNLNNAESHYEFVGSEVFIDPDEMEYVDGGGQGIVYRWQNFALKFHYDDSALKRLLEMRQRALLVGGADRRRSIPKSVLLRTFPIGFGTAEPSDLNLEHGDDLHVLVFNWVEGQCLDHEEYRDYRIRCMMADRVLEGLSFIEQLRIVHADLVPSNILVDENEQPHLIDIAGAGLIEYGTGKWKYPPSVQGTKIPGFVSPPEMQKPGGEIDKYTDRWCGVTLICAIIARESPFFFLRDSTVESLQEMQYLAAEGFQQKSELRWPPHGIKNHSKLHPEYRKEGYLDYYRGYWDSIDPGGRLIGIMFNTYIRGLEKRQLRASFSRIRTMLGLL